MEETLVKAPNEEPISEQVYVESVEDEFIAEPEPEEESASSTNINYEVYSVNR